MPPLCLSFSFIHSLSCLNYLVLSSSSKSPVVSVGFARFHPNLLVGGTYSGQIVLWDNRSHRRTPVQRTPLSAAAHTVRQYPKYYPHTLRPTLLELNATKLWPLIHEEDFNLKLNFSSHSESMSPIRLCHAGHKAQDWGSAHRSA